MLLGRPQIGEVGVIDGVDTAQRVQLDGDRQVLGGRIERPLCDVDRGHEIGEARVLGASTAGAGDDQRFVEVAEITLVYGLEVRIFGRDLFAPLDALVGDRQVTPGAG